MTCELVFFFFQAEDGIRDLTVTGVQTCALPIYHWAWQDVLQAQAQRRTRQADEAQRWLHGHGQLLPAEADRKSTRLNSSHSQISYAVFCLKKKKTTPAVRHAHNSVARPTAVGGI